MSGENTRSAADLLGSWVLGERNVSHTEEGVLARCLRLAVEIRNLIPAWHAQARSPQVP
jgi:hypothetical protein